MAVKLLLALAAFAWCLWESTRPTGAREPHIYFALGALLITALMAGGNG